MEYELTIRTNDRDELKALLSCDETPQGCPSLREGAALAHVDVQSGDDVLVTDDGRVFAQIGLDADVSDTGAIPPGYRRTNSLPALQESAQRFEDGVRNTLSRLDKGRQQPKIIGR